MLTLACRAMQFQMAPDDCVVNSDSKHQTCPMCASCRWGDCNNDPSDGCETDLTTSASNCGACGVVATLPNAVTRCMAGHVAVASCAAG
jgi:hypothetical protein